MEDAKKFAKKSVKKSVARRDREADRQPVARAAARADALGGDGEPARPGARSSERLAQGGQGLKQRKQPNDLLIGGSQPHVPGVGRARTLPLPADVEDVDGTHRLRKRKVARRGGLAWREAEDDHAITDEHEVDTEFGGSRGRVRADRLAKRNAGAILARIATGGAAHKGAGGARAMSANAHADVADTNNEVDPDGTAAADEYADDDEAAEEAIVLDNDSQPPPEDEYGQHHTSASEDGDCRPRTDVDSEADAFDEGDAGPSEQSDGDAHAPTNAGSGQRSTMDTPRTQARSARPQQRRVMRTHATMGNENTHLRAWDRARALASSDEDARTNHEGVHALSFENRQAALSEFLHPHAKDAMASTGQRVDIASRVRTDADNAVSRRLFAPPPTTPQAMVSGGRTVAGPGLDTPRTAATMRSDASAKAAEAMAHMRTLTDRCSSRITSVTKTAFPKKFAGMPSQDFDEFFARFQQRAALCTWTDADQIVAMLGCLEGAAATVYHRWMQDGELEHLAMSEVSEKLRRAFPSSTARNSDALRRFTQLRQRADESVTQLAERFHECLRSCSLSAEHDSVREQWLRAIGPRFRSAMVREYVHSGQRITLQELISMAVQLESLMREDEPAAGKKRHTDSDVDGDPTRTKRHKGTHGDKYVDSDDSAEGSVVGSDGGPRRVAQGKRSAPLYAIGDRQADTPPRKKRKGDGDDVEAHNVIAQLRSAEAAAKTMVTRLEATAERIQNDIVRGPGRGDQRYQDAREQPSGQRTDPSGRRAHADHQRSDTHTSAAQDGSVDDGDSARAYRTGMSGYGYGGDAPFRTNHRGSYGRGFGATRPPFGGRGYGDRGGYGARGNRDFHQRREYPRIGGDERNTHSRYARPYAQREGQGNAYTQPDHVQGADDRARGAEGQQSHVAATHNYAHAALGGYEPRYIAMPYPAMSMPGTYPHGYAMPVHAMHVVPQPRPAIADGPATASQAAPAASTSTPN